MRPKDFRIRFLPVKDCAILCPNRRGRRVRARNVHASTLMRPDQERRTPESPSFAEGAPSLRPEGGWPSFGAKARERIASETNQIFRESGDIGDEWGDVKG